MCILTCIALALLAPKLTFARRILICHSRLGTAARKNQLEDGFDAPSRLPEELVRKECGRVQDGVRQTRVLVGLERDVSRPLTCRLATSGQVQGTTAEISAKTGVQFTSEPGTEA